MLIVLYHATCGQQGVSGVSGVHVSGVSAGCVRKRMRPVLMHQGHTEELSAPYSTAAVSHTCVVRSTATRYCRQIDDAC
jgi:hypothetical protein